MALALSLSLLIVPLTSERAAAAEIARYQPPAPPAISAKAVYVADVTTGTELFALNADTPLPPASLTKIVAALVILERADLADIVTISEDDLVAEEESQVGLVAGDRLSVRDLLFGLLIPSGNDAALALARHVGADASETPLAPDEAVARFVSLMNEKAAALGATASHFANPTGMDAPEHVMSARDIAIVTNVALDDPLFAEIVSTPSTTLGSETRSEGYPVTTTNALLAEGLVNGVKTGTTPSAGGCLVTSFLVGPNTVVAVVLGSELTETAGGEQDNSARFADTRALLTAVTAEYAWLDPLGSGAVEGLVDELAVWNVASESNALLPVPATKAADVRYRLVLAPPSEPGRPAGEIRFFVGDQMLSARSTIQSG
jgi:D-alanyl-D-alanine carboxypeptidase (penicillin-binding protein 5/6)